MTVNQLLDRVCAYAGTTLASKAKSKVTQFVLGAASAGAGRRALEEKVSSMSAYFTKPDGEVDVASLQESAMAGFKAAGSLPVLGGMVSVDAADAADFFASLPVE